MWNQAANGTQQDVPVDDITALPLFPAIHRHEHPPSVPTTTASKSTKRVTFGPTKITIITPRQSQTSTVDDDEDNSCESFPTPQDFVAPPVVAVSWHTTTITDNKTATVPLGALLVSDDLGGSSTTSPLMPPPPLQQQPAFCDAVTIFDDSETQCTPTVERDGAMQHISSGSNTEVSALDFLKSFVARDQPAAPLPASTTMSDSPSSTLLSFCDNPPAQCIDEEAEQGSRSAPQNTFGEDLLLVSGGLATPPVNDKDSGVTAANSHRSLMELPLSTEVSRGETVDCTQLLTERTTLQSQRAPPLPMEWSLSESLEPSHSMEEGSEEDTQQEVGAIVCCVFCAQSYPTIVQHSNYPMHIHCALWCPEVYCDPMSQTLRNVKEALERCADLSCALCGRDGASIGCAVEECECSYHFHCALSAGCEMIVPTSTRRSDVLENFVLRCPLHKRAPKRSKRPRGSA